MAISEKLCYLERSSWPANVGIHAMEIYFPKLYVCQQELEKYDRVSQGKYTIGLGQSQMGFCSDQEDIHSLCLTVLSKMMERTGIGFQNVGRLEVGTETILDKSKSVKSVLMKLFEESGNNDVEGVDSTNACYGGTAALFNAVNWVESSSWDGRYAVVVAADIAIYPKGPARPTGGAGAVAMLIGPNAPLVIDRGVRSSYMAHNYDFYKPDLASDYPKVDGQLTIQCYFSALDSCYKTYLQKASRLNLELQERQLPTCLEDFGAFAFHSPYCKLVQKSFARLALNDFLSSSSSAATAKHATLMKYHDRRLEDTYFDKEVEKVFMTETKDMFENKTKPSLRLASRVGNMYTPSLYGGLVSILASLSDCDLFAKHIGMFSYGSGTASSMFSILVRSDEESRSHLLRMSQEASTTLRRLDERIEVSPYNFAKVLDERERNHLTIPFTPYAPTSTLFSGSWYLNHVDDQHRRTYSRLFPGPINGHQDSASVGQISSQCNGHVDTNGGSRNLPVDDVRKEASS